MWTWSAVAFVASAAHVAIDFLADVYPWSVSGALVAVSAAAVYALWAAALRSARRGSADALRAAALLALVQAALANGVIALVPCPPVALVGAAAPCALAPWQDLAHVASAVAGAVAAWLLRPARIGPPRRSRLTVAAALALATHLALAWTIAAATT